MKHLKLTIWLWACYFSFAIAQSSDTTKGIRFRQGLSWDQIKLKAAAEQKFIFIDYYATWCGPCKKMDALVYPIDSVGQFYNTNFISLKVQLDSSGSDNENVKNWRREAKTMQLEYKISALPTFLFFSPNGKLVHKGVGMLAPNKFMQLGKSAINPQMQYFTALDAFRGNTLSHNGIFRLALLAKSFDEHELAAKTSQKYIEEVLVKLKFNQSPTPQDIVFMKTFMTTSHDRSFHYFISNVHTIDSVMKLGGYVWNVVDPIIERENIDAFIYKGGNKLQVQAGQPKWKELFKKIMTKYNSGYSDRVILWAKIKWYENQKNWPMYSKYVVEKVEKYGAYNKIFGYVSVTTSSLEEKNNCSWDMFSYSNDKKCLGKALKWSKEVIDNDPDHDALNLDTYANLLYKIGKKTEAISLEKKILTSVKPTDSVHEIIAKTLVKMKNGQPTWLNK